MNSLRLREAGDFDWEQRAPRTLDVEQAVRFEGYLEEILVALGMEPGAPGTVDTPRRLLRALLDATSGYEGDEKLLASFPSETPPEAGDGARGQILEGPIPFHALCEHHALPFIGRAFLAYLPGERIIGISKLTRLVRLFARRFTVQERVGRQIADALEAILAPVGIGVYLEAEHLCTQMRGVRDLETMTRTTVWRGAFATSSELREEFLRMVALAA